MKIADHQVESIKAKFSSLETRDDLVRLLSMAKKLQYGKSSTPFQLKSITYYANPKLCKKRYSVFEITKKSGKPRTIQAPVKSLKYILRALNLVLQCIAEPHAAATGFVVDRSIVDNAKMHVGKNYVYNIDLKDFFHSFDRNRVKMGFMAAPFNLKGDREPLAFLLACLCTHPLSINGTLENVLPQGSPTSPTITNILCSKLDRRLNGLAKRFGAVYTRYADDITFSSMQNIFRLSEFQDELKRIITVDQKFEIRSEKTRLQKKGYRQEVTGLVVQSKVNVRRRYVKQIRMWIAYWEKYGYDKAQRIFERDYIQDKGHVKMGKPNLDSVLMGKLNYLRMVKGEKDSTYLRLISRLNKLTSSGSLKGGEDSLGKVVDTILNSGLVEGITLYDKLKLRKNEG